MQQALQALVRQEVGYRIMRFDSVKSLPKDSNGVAPSQVGVTECWVLRSEHLCFPDGNRAREGVVEEEMGIFCVESCALSQSYPKRRSSSGVEEGE